jgi:Flp pilus assembly protein CpaB
LLAACFAAVAVVGLAQAVAPHAARTVRVWAAAHDLSGGAPLTATDLAALALPVATVPAGALPTTTHLVGRLLAAPVRRGEPITDVRLLGTALLRALPRPGLVAVPVKLADPSAAAAIVRAGDRVDVIAIGDPADGSSPVPTRVARGVEVLSVPSAAAIADGSEVVVLAVTPAIARRLAAAAVGARLSLALRQP